MGKIFGTKRGPFDRKLSFKKISSYASPNQIYINSGVLPTAQLISKIQDLQLGQSIFEEENLIAVRTNEPQSFGFETAVFKKNEINFNEKIIAIRQLTDLVVYNGKLLGTEIQEFITTHTTTVIKDDFTVLYNKTQIYIGQNVNIKGAILDATKGPILIDDNATVDIGVLVQGPAYIGKNSTLNLGAKIRPNTNIGPNCKVGGEVSNSIILGYSNKGHDGFMGNSYIAEWCNWGAGTNNSNLKNDYSTVKLFDYSTQQLEDSKELFAGLFVADHSKAAIATKFNTGTVVGFNCNIFCDGFPEKHIPSFTWGGGLPLVQYQFEKAWQVAQNTAQRRGVTFDTLDKDIFTYIYEHFSASK